MLVTPYRKLLLIRSIRLNSQNRLVEAFTLSLFKEGFNNSRDIIIKTIEHHSLTPKSLNKPLLSPVHESSFKVVGKN